ncbi:MAG: hypothetical protein VW268_02850 [Rhodospirillaceae bacterium]
MGPKSDTEDYANAFGEDGEDNGMDDGLNAEDQERIEPAEEVVCKMTASYFEWVENDLRGLAGLIDNLDPAAGEPST